MEIAIKSIACRLFDQKYQHLAVQIGKEYYYFISVHPNSVPRFARDLVENLEGSNLHLKIGETNLSSDKIMTLGRDALSWFTGIPSTKEFLTAFLSRLTEREEVIVDKFPHDLVRQNKEVEGASLCSIV